MEEEKKDYRVWIIVALIGGLLVGCVVGALAGGAVGYWAARRTVQIERRFGPFGYEGEPGRPFPLPEIPHPRIPEVSPDFDLPPMMQGGALVVRVVEDSPAERAGLRAGDMIVEVDSDPLEEGESLAERISDYDPGAEVELTVIRQGRERIIEVELGERPGREGGPWLGIDYRDMPRFEFRFQRPGRGWRRSPSP